MSQPFLPEGDKMKCIGLRKELEALFKDNAEISSQIKEVAFELYKAEGGKLPTNATPQTIPLKKILRELNYVC